MKHWYALYTQPRKERQVHGWLVEQGFESFLPTVRRKVRRSDRPDEMVYFPCYLFARFDFNDTPQSSIAWMPGIRRIVSFGEQPAIVPEELVDLIRHRLSEVDEVGYPRLKQGDRVRFLSGPLRDLDAIFDRPLSSADRVRVLLKVMGRMTAVDTDYSAITPV